jgi:16S rRNA (cytidine1402-2'-O)-methyltransferase
MSSLTEKPRGSLFIVATPIGHLGDITFRAIETLKTVDVILAEDTRHANILMQHYQIHTTIESFHTHNEQKKSEHYITMLQKGKQLALISDAGTPLISDPGYPLVHLARNLGISVIPIPGPSALICALSAAGVATDEFSFYGFPPAKSSARIKFFQNCLQQERTIVFYESTHRILDSLKDLSPLLQQNPIVIAKELTKSYEQFKQGCIDEVLQWFAEDTNRSKGEFVVIIPARKGQEDHHASEQILKILLQELPTKQAVNICQKITGDAKNHLYELAIRLQKV